MFNLTMPSNIKAAMTESTFGIKAEVTNESVELMVMDDIGEYGIAAPDVSAFLASSKGKPINVKINSFGGDVYAGLSIYNDLLHHGSPVSTEVTGVAYSAASVIFLAGDDRLMHEASDFGIHRAWSGAVGNQKVMLAMHEWLATIDEHMVDLYQIASGNSTEQINQWVDGTDGMSGTVFSAKEAKAAGFATEVIPSKKPKKSLIPETAKSLLQLKYQAEMASLARRNH